MTIEVVAPMSARSKADASTAQTPPTRLHRREAEALGNLPIVQAYFHSHVELEVGHVVHPGAWGKRVLEEGSAHPWFEREQLLEAVRTADFRDLPSRLTSLFVWPQLKRALMVPDRPHVYLVEVQEPTQWFIADLLWIDVALPVADSDDARQEAVRRYWSGDRYYGAVPTDPDSREILATTPATVRSTCLHSNA